MSAFLALASSLIWGTADFCGGMLAKRVPAVLVVALSQAAALVLLIVLLVVSGGGSAAGWLPSMAAGVAGAAGLAAFYAALSSGAMGVVSPIASLGAVVAVLWGVAAGERFGAVVAAGMAVAVLGAMLAAGPELSPGTSARPVLLALGAAVGFGCALYLLHVGAEHGLLPALLAMRVGGQLVIWPMVLLHRVRSSPSLPRPRGRDWLQVLAIGWGDLAANALFAAAATSGSVGVASVLGSMFPVATVLLAWFVLRERLRPIQYAGVGLAVLGVVLTSSG